MAARPRPIIDHFALRLLHSGDWVLHLSDPSVILKVERKERS